MQPWQRQAIAAVVPVGAVVKRAEARHEKPARFRSGGNIVEHLAEVRDVFERVLAQHNIESRGGRQRCYRQGEEPNALSQLRAALLAMLDCKRNARRIEIDSQDFDRAASSSIE